MNLIPSSGRHVIKAEPLQLKSNDLILVEFEKEDTKHLRGVVVSASEGYYTMNGEYIKSQFKVGDAVWYFKYNAAPISLGRDSFVVVGENDIVAKEG